VRKNRKPKPISRYFEKPIPTPIPTFEKTDQKNENRYRLKKPIPTQLYGKPRFRVASRKSRSLPLEVKFYYATESEIRDVMSSLSVNFKTLVNVSVSVPYSMSWQKWTFNLKIAHITALDTLLFIDPSTLDFLVRCGSATECGKLETDDVRDAS